MNLFAEAMVYGQIETAGNGILPMVCNLVSGVKTTKSFRHDVQMCKMEYMHNIVDAPMLSDQNILQFENRIKKGDFFT